jgi:drug/metabolite transporter (DMT)-like permease
MTHSRQLRDLSPRLDLLSWSDSPSTKKTPTALFAFSNPYQNASIASLPWVSDQDQASLMQHEQGRVVSFSPFATVDEEETNDGLVPLLQLQESDVASSASTKQEEKDRAVFFARLLLIGAAALYGTNFSLVKIMGESQLPVGVSSSLRFGLAALVTSPWLFASPQSEATTSLVSDKDAWKMEAWPAIVAGMEVGVWNSIGFISQAVGLQTTAASKSAFLCSLAVVVVPFLDVWSGKKLEARQWAGALLALGGVAFLELGDGYVGAWTSGDVASMVQPVAFGLGFWRLEEAMRKYPNQGKRSTAAQILAVFLGCVVYTAATEVVNWDQIVQYLSEPTTLMLLAWMGVMSTAVSAYMEAVALKTLSAAETTLLLSTEPLWGALFASVLVGEHLGTDTVFGGLLVLAGCLYSSLGWEKLKNLATGGMSIKMMTGSMGVESNLSLGDSSQHEH